MALKSVVQHLQRKPLTYTQARLTRHTTLLDTGQATFKRARLALRDFATHQSHGLRLFPADSPPDAWRLC
ncbi:DUF1990 family protein [Deinococcus alpinitundrae]|uniref:DUF1990 family protein n=1 Tax=Deinococcus alpinitundrae TaxID=468913 RepID=UPI00137AE657|nr:DUF1990 family protein [Deinococcus alpinitundrae]